MPSPYPTSIMSLWFLLPSDTHRTTTSGSSKLTSSVSAPFFLSTYLFRRAWREFAGIPCYCLASLFTSAFVQITCFLFGFIVLVQARFLVPGSRVFSSSAMMWCEKTGAPTAPSTNLSRFLSAGTRAHRAQLYPGGEGSFERLGSPCVGAAGGVHHEQG